MIIVLTTNYGKTAVNMDLVYTFFALDDGTTRLNFSADRNLLNYLIVNESFYDVLEKLA